VLPPSRIGSHRTPSEVRVYRVSGISRVRVWIRVGARIRFSFSGAKLCETRGGVADPEPE